MEIQVVGAINEDFPAEPADTAAWVSRMWNFDPNYDQTTWPISRSRGASGFPAGSPLPL